MLLSMTGYGRAETNAGPRSITAELRALNGKTFELTAKLPAALRAREIEVRNLVAGLLVRGTADLTVVIRQDGVARPMVINTELATAYFRSVETLSRTLGLPAQGEGILSTLLRLPEVVTPAEATEALPDSAWAAVRDTVTAAATALLLHRQTEGSALEADLRARIAAIQASLADVLPLEESRKDRVRERLTTLMDEAGARETADGNRFEQELIYYLERSDFSEEKTRLTQHCIYFLELLDEAGSGGVGKRLNFVLQEIGREINTLGSKAGDAAIQRIVVGMKDELEKAKEQVLNVL